MRIGALAILLMAGLWLLLDLPARSQPLPAGTVENDLERLLQTARPFVRHSLLRYGELFPVALVMQPDGTLRYVGLPRTEGSLTPEAAVDFLIRAFGLEAAGGELRACIIAHEALYQPPDGGPAVAAVAFRIDHREGRSVVWYVPRSADGRDLTETRIETPGKHAIFGKPLNRRRKGKHP